MHSDKGKPSAILTGEALERDALPGVAHPAPSLPGSALFANVPTITRCHSVALI